MSFDSFIKLAGVKGESNDSKHKDEIEVLSFHWGAHNGASAHHGSGSGAGKVSIQNFCFVHKIDAASPILFQKCCDGSHIATADFVVRKAGGSQIEYLKIKLSEVIVTSVRPGGSAHGAEDIPLEEVTLSFDIATVDYQPQGKDGAAQGGAIHGGWSLKTNAKV